MRNALFILAILALVELTSATDFQAGDKVGIMMGLMDEDTLMGSINSIDNEFLCLHVTEAYTYNKYQNWTYPIDMCIKKSRINIIIAGK